MLNSDSISLLFSAKGDTDDAKKAFDDLKTSIDKNVKDIEKTGTDGTTKLSGGFASLQSSIAPMIESVAAAAAGAAVMTAGFVAAGTALFNLAKQTAEAGTELANFQKLTGLTAESIGSIKTASEAAGTSLDEFEEVWESFIEVLIEGGKGADDAKEKLKQAGIDPQKGFKDLEGSVQKAFDAIRKAETQAEKSAIAMAVFGESGLNMVKVADEMTGGFDQFKKKLVETGAIMNQDGIRTSKEFDRSLKDLEKQASGVTTQFALGLMPSITRAMESISGSLKGNKSVWRDWGETIGDIILRMVRGTRLLLAGMKDVAERNFSGLNTQLAMTQNANEYEAEQRQKTIEKNQNDPNRAEFLTQQDKDIETLGKNSGFKPQDAEKAKKAADDLIKANQAAQERINKAIADGNRAAYEKEQAQLIEQYKERGITAEKFNNEFLENERQFRVKMLETIASEFAQKRANEKNKKAKKALNLEEQNEKDKIIDESTKREQEAQKLITETVKQETEKRKKADEESVRNRIALYKQNTDAAIKESENQFRKTLITEEQHIQATQNLKLNALIFEKRELEKLDATRENLFRLDQLRAEASVLINENEIQWREFYEKSLDSEIEKRGKVLEIEQRIAEEKERQQRSYDIAPAPGYDAAGNETTIAPVDNSFLSIWGDSWRNFVKTIEQDSVGVGNVLAQTGGLFLDFFQNMANATGQAIENWALYGGSVGKALKQALAAELAHIAGVATVKALYATALGFIRLAELNFPAAGWAFLSAGMWAALAGGTALAARGLAGNNAANQSFRNETTGAFGTASGGGSIGSYNSQNEGAKIIELGRNSAFQPKEPQEIKIKYVGDSIFANMFEAEIYQNGKLRRVLLDNIAD